MEVISCKLPKFRPKFEISHPSFFIEIVVDKDVESTLRERGAIIGLKLGGTTY